MKKKTTVPFSIGIDLAKKTFDVALACDGVDLDSWRDLPGTHVDSPPDSQKGIRQFMTWLRDNARPEQCLRVVVESTGQTSKRFARALRDHGLPEVAIVNPARPKAFGVAMGIRDKNDPVDAAVLSLFGAIRRPKPAPLRTEAEEALRALTRLRQSCQADITAWRNRLGEACDREAKASIKRTIKYFEKQVKDLDKCIQKRVDENEALARQVKGLKKIKGIKQVGATTITAELGDLTRYSRSQLVGAAGLYPRTYESGTSVRKRPRLVKGGGSRIRRVLYMCATSLFRSKGPLRDRIEAMRAQGIKDMVIIGVMMRKLLLIARAVAMNNGVYEPSKICREAA